MAKPTFKPNPAVTQLFDDLDRYLKFCVEYGYKYDEANLYDPQSYVWRQALKESMGKFARNQWQENARP